MEMEMEMEKKKLDLLNKEKIHRILFPFWAAIWCGQHAMQFKCAALYRMNGIISME